MSDARQRLQREIAGEMRSDVVHDPVNAPLIVTRHRHRIVRAEAS